MPRRPTQVVDLLQSIDGRMAKRAAEAAAWLKTCRDSDITVTVAHHIDADGVTSGAIALETLARAGIKSREVACKSLDDLHIAQLQGGEHEALWFCDFGSTAYMHFEQPKLVCDHHQLVRDGAEESFPHVNPLLDDLEGDEISGAGCAFLVAVALDPANLDLLPVALVGATADLQDRHGGFSGINQVLVEVGKMAGLIESQTELSFFGSQTRPLRTFLAYADVKIPGATGSRRAAEAFLGQLGIALKEGAKERSWCHLSEEEKKAVRTGLVNRLLDAGLPTDGLWRQMVTISGAEDGSPVRELQEFGTLLNSTARYDEPATGLAVARGDRGDAYQAALGLRDDHKKNLVKSLDAFGKAGIQEMSAIQWAHLESMVRDTVVGIVCGMALDGLGLRRDMPLIGFAHTPDGRTKVSSRSPHELKGRIDLATAMRESAAAVGGQGGGHEGAAGATIPRGSEPQFLAVADKIVATQLGIMAAPVRGQSTLF